MHAEKFESSVPPNFSVKVGKDTFRSVISTVNNKLFHARLNVGVQVFYTVDEFCSDCSVNQEEHVSNHPRAVRLQYTISQWTVSPKEFGRGRGVVLC